MVKLLKSTGIACKMCWVWTQYPQYTLIFSMYLYIHGRIARLYRRCRMEKTAEKRVCPLYMRDIVDKTAEMSKSKEYLLSISI